jgi:formylglycine-generating enzyme
MYRFSILRGFRFMKRTRGFLMVPVLACLAMFAGCYDYFYRFEEVPCVGEIMSFAVGNYSMHLVLAHDPEEGPAGGTVVFPMGEKDDSTGSMSGKFFIGTNEVTYSQWRTIYAWATDPHRGEVPTTTGDGSRKLYKSPEMPVYAFAHPGVEGNDGTAGANSLNSEPVTTISWCDAVVWCNALTEWYNATRGTGYKYVYTTDSTHETPVRDSGAVTVNVTINPSADGFRLPTMVEWEYAARYTGYDGRWDLVAKGFNGGSSSLSERLYWYPGDYASGATAPYTDSAATGQAAWYDANSGGVTHDVSYYDNSTGKLHGKAENALHMSDVSGNVAEFCGDLPAGSTEVYPSARGGAWNSGAESLAVGTFIEVDLNGTYSHIGFRVAKTQLTSSISANISAVARRHAAVFIAIGAAVLGLGTLGGIVIYRRRRRTA